MCYDGNESTGATFAPGNKEVLDPLEGPCRLVSFVSLFFFFSSRRRHTRCSRDWSSDVCSSDLAQAALAAAQPTMARLGTMLNSAGLAQLDELDGQLASLGVAPAEDGRDPPDSLWRAARRALNRGDYATAANLYGDLARTYPSSSRAGDAIYWSAFALYKNDDLDHARSLLVTQQRRYPKAATMHDGDALLARIQTALARQGDSGAAAWLAEHAREAGGPTGKPPKGESPTGAPGAPGAGQASCTSEDDEDDVRVAALNGDRKSTRLNSSHGYISYA